MTEISRERRATLRGWCDFCEEKGLPYPLDPKDVRALLNYADERDRAEGRMDRLEQEAELQAQEARTANHTIAEIYQLCTGATGEPGNWNGAEPVRRLLARAEQAEERNRRLEAALRGLYDAVEADDGVAWWHMDRALDALSAEPEQGEPNQCDGCRRDLPIVNGIHVDHNGMPVMVCTADRYDPAPTPDGGEGALEAELEQVCALASAGYKDALCARTECQYGGECVGRCDNPRRHPRTICNEVRRALREPRVPGAVRRLPDEWRARRVDHEAGVFVQQLHGMTIAADELDRALAQHGEKNDES